MNHEPSTTGIVRNKRGYDISWKSHMPLQDAFPMQLIAHAHFHASVNRNCTTSTSFMFSITTE